MENLSARGLKALFALKRYIFPRNVKVRLGIKLFDQMIKQILCYESELWSACDLDKRKFRTKDGLAKYLDSTAIEKVHVKFCKFIMGVNKRVVNLAVKGELGRFPKSFSCIIKLLNIGITYRKLLTLYFRRLHQLVKVFIIMVYRLGFHFTIVYVNI